MSSDLRELIRKDLERIPLPASAAWTQRRARRPARALRVVLVAFMTVSVVVASLVGGQLVRIVRDRIETLRAASGLVAGNDLVYLMDGSAATQGLQVVTMPGGQSVGRYVGSTYVGTDHEGVFMITTGDYAYLPVARGTGVGSDEYEAYLQQIDLRRGIPLARLAAGTGTIQPALQAELPGTPTFPAATATSPDGRTVWLVRDTGPRGQGTLLARFDIELLPEGVRIVSGRSNVPLDGGGQGAVRSRLVPLSNDRLAVARDQYIGGAHVATDWYFVDRDFNVIAKYTSQDGRALPDSGRCEIAAGDVGAAWAVVCSDRSGSADGAVIFHDHQSFAVTATVGLPREQGFVLGSAVSSDGTLTILTERPLVARVNMRDQTLIDVRPVVQTRSWFEHLLPDQAAAKELGGPSVAFSPDGRYAYLAASASRWWGTLAIIDLAKATVVANTTAVGTVIGVELSAGGERLYALAMDDQGRRQVVLLDPRNLAIAGRSTALDFSPQRIVAVRPNAASGAATSPTAHPTAPALPLRDQLVADVHAVQRQLAFRPLVPEAMPMKSAAVVSTRICGLATTPCLEYTFPDPADGSVLVLQGTAGCCLDVGRPNAVMDVNLRPGVEAQFVPVEPQFGGSILWWVEDTGAGRVYVALSSPVYGRDELIALARSMAPVP